MREYLRRIPPVTVDVSATARAVPAETLLTALAFAEAPGLPASLWRAALQALGAGDVPEATLIRFARSAAASFLVESFSDEELCTAFRLFPQALNSILLHDRAKVANLVNDERALTLAFLEAGRDGGWERAPAYLRRSLPTHAARAQLIDDLLIDDGYLLHADLRRVLQAARHAISPEALDRARLVGLTPDAVTAGPADRAAMFSVTETLDGLGGAYRQNSQSAPYRAKWAAADPRREDLILRHAHGTVALWTVNAGDRALLATSTSDGTVLLWDPADGSRVLTLQGAGYEVKALCTVNAGGRTLLAAGNVYGTVQLWDLVDGSRVHALGNGSVSAMCAVDRQGRTLLAVGSFYGTVQLWDPADGSKVSRALECHPTAVETICAVHVGGQALLATRGAGGTLRLWDLAGGSRVRTLRPAGEMTALCVVDIEGRALLATGSGDGSVVLWDPADGSQVRILQWNGNEVKALLAVQAEGRTLLATSSRDGVVLWDPADGSLVRALQLRNQVSAACLADAGGRALVATSDREGTVRLWNTRSPAPHKKVDDYRISVSAVGAGVLPRLLSTRYREGTGRMCAVDAGGRTLLATSTADRTVVLWDPADGSRVRALQGSGGEGLAWCTVDAGGRTLLATRHAGGTVGLWDPADGSRVRTLQVDRYEVLGLCAVDAAGRTLLAASTSRGTVLLWDPADGSQVHVLKDHQASVGTVCAVQAGNRSLLVTGSDDWTVRLWDPVDGRCVLTVPVHHAVSATAWVAGSLAIGLTAGLLVIKFEADVLARRLSA